jgi:hypothetical protein
MSEKEDLEEYKKYPYEHHRKGSKPVDNSKTMKILKAEIDKNLARLNLANEIRNGKHPPKTMTNKQLENIYDEVQNNIRRLIDKQKLLFSVDVDSKQIRKSKHSKRVRFSPNVKKAGIRKTRKSKSFFSMFK